MLRFIARHGLVRVIGGRAVPALMLWDLAMLANRTRQIPVVDRAFGAVPTWPPGAFVRASSRAHGRGARPGREAPSIRARRVDDAPDRRPATPC